jgi:DNA replication protein DnaC
MQLNRLELPEAPHDLPGMRPGASVDALKEMDKCEQHGPYLVRSGSVRYMVAHNPGGCPQCLAEKNASQLMADSNMPARFTNATFESYEAEGPKQTKVLQACRDYAENFATYRKQGRCLIMCGNPGTGKNHLATAIFKTLNAAGFTSLRVKASEYLDAYWAKDFKERDDWLRGMFRVDLLIIDEVEKASKTDNAKNAMFRLIDGRYESMSPTLLITNQARAELIETLGDPAYDRLTEGGSQRLVFDWASRRSTVIRGEV